MRCENEEVELHEAADEEAKGVADETAEEVAEEAAKEGGRADRHRTRATRIDVLKAMPAGGPRDGTYSAYMQSGNACFPCSMQGAAQTL